MNIKKDNFMGGMLMVIASTIFISTKPILGRIAMEHGLMPGPLVVLRLTIAFPLFALTLIAMERMSGMKLSMRELMFIAFGSMTLGGAMVLSFYSIYHLGASVSTLVIFIFPAITAILTYFIYGQPVTGIKKVSLTVSFIGIVFVVLPTSGADAPNMSLAGTVKGGLPMIGIIYGLLTACCWAGAQLFFETLTKKKSPYVISVYTTGIMLLFFTILYGFPQTDLKKEAWTAVILLGTIGWYIPFLLAIYGIKVIGASNSSIAQSIGPGLVVLYAWILLGETLATGQVAGMVLLIYAVYILKNEKKVIEA